jgi:anti-anti-sigma factor
MEHTTQTAGVHLAPETGSKARDSLPVSSQLFTAAVQRSADRAVVVLRGELDLMSVGALVDCLAEIAYAVKEVVLDFAELDFIECSGLNAIAAATQALAAHGGSLSIRCPCQQAQRLLDLVNFEQIVAEPS